MATSRNRAMVKEAKGYLNRLKMESASEVGVSIKEDGYNGDLTSRQAGSIGGQMVNMMCTERSMSERTHYVHVRTMKFERAYRWVDGHSKVFTYTYGLTI